MRRNFIKVEEDFVCGNCSANVHGTGYTNHCPKCLWSKHVDEFVSGDRKSGCLGMMEPIGTQQKKGQWRVIHKCTKCGKTIKNKVVKNDDWNLVATIGQ